jgi:hypothetical protein
MSTGLKIVDNSLPCLDVGHPKPAFFGGKTALFAGVKVVGCGEKWPNKSVKYIQE